MYFGKVMKIGFVTCVQLGLSCIEAIYSVGGKLDIAITLHDHKATNKSGRVYLDKFCNVHEVPLLKIDHINELSVVAAIKKMELDWLFIIGWSQIAGQELLDAPKNGVLGMHPTLLPEGRGRAAIPWAILKGLERTGVTLFKLDSGVDTGPIADQYEILLSPVITATELYKSVDHAHAELIKQVMPKILAGNLVLREQDDSRATLWPGRTPEDGVIDLSASVSAADCLIRATTRPYPGAFFYENDKKVIVWRAEIVAYHPEEKCLNFNDGYLRLLDWEYAADVI
jgi:methionyl-tRNA formyltransferase